MKDLKKKFGIGALAVTLVGGFAAGAGANSMLETVRAHLDHRIDFQIDGEAWQPSRDGQNLSAIVYQGNTYLPVRAVGDAFDVAIDWKSDTRTVLIGETNERTSVNDLSLVRDRYFIEKTIDPQYVNREGNLYPDGLLFSQLNSASKAFAFETGNTYQTVSFDIHLLTDNQATLKFKNGDTVIREVKVTEDDPFAEVTFNIGGVNELTIEGTGTLGGGDDEVFISGEVY
ncbi:stalk domain-containing protein [Desertibacillus haloalkaliphilus]|uniref:stalk domain-containing protein n=1 Tax=Desertibacillus haloalkaliphilus TaxID=1328930 RepID=UPI001C26DAF5|nr:stalk domain-containing protein [Desertibacillus haloalkaliphilus]MBU8906006.1 copper amine oxidase N-terminal domain-containing protein [Desertibacillus haloalkaliphilus]